MPYSALTEHDRAQMMETIGIESVDELFADIPEELRRNVNPNIGEALSELSTRRKMSALAAQNTSLENVASFLGAGNYDHFIPSVVGALASRGEFATAYTPYQAETSQGTLQVVYEFQTLLCQLTEMEMANASLYDGATALAEALIMAMAITKRRKFLLPRALSPFYRQVAQTYLQGLNVEIVDIEYSNGASANGASANGATNLQDLQAKLDESVAAVVVAQPNFFGVVEDARAFADAAHERGALLISVFNPLTLGILASPGSYDADIAVGEGQSLGIAPQFGGPGLGLFCCRKNHARFAPGRLVGTTTDEAGRSGFTLTLQTREQHIRREKATSNICSNQALCALTATIFLSAMGPHGVREMAMQSHHKAHHLARKLAEIDGVKLLFSTPWFHEFVVQLPKNAAEINARLIEYSILGGLDLSRDFPELGNAMLLCCTEKRTREEIDAFADALREILK